MTSCAECKEYIEGDIYTCDDCARDFCSTCADVNANGVAGACPACGGFLSSY